MKVIFATKNQGKVKEVREILGDIGIEVLTMTEAGIDVEVVEDGTTFEENAIKKAKEIMEKSNTLVLSDDSGLEVDYLNGEPGVYSARYLGEDTPYTVKNNKILDMMYGVPDESRGARFVCVIAAVFPDGKIVTTKGTIEGKISLEIKGENGFGYDPIFYVPELGKNTAELTAEEKNAISHRGQALRQMAEELKKIM